MNSIHNYLMLISIEKFLFLLIYVNCLLIFQFFTFSMRETCLILYLSGWLLAVPITSLIIKVTCNKPWDMSFRNKIYTSVIAPFIQVHKPITSFSNQNQSVIKSCQFLFLNVYQIYLFQYLFLSIFWVHYCSRNPQSTLLPLFILSAKVTFNCSPFFSDPSPLSPSSHSRIFLPVNLYSPVGELCPAEPSYPSQMRIILPRHDLLGEERWPISQTRRALSLFLNGFLLGLICIGIQGI